MALYKGTTKIAETFGTVNNLAVNCNACVCGNIQAGSANVDTIEANCVLIIPSTPSSCINAIWID